VPIRARAAGAGRGFESKLALAVAEERAEPERVVTRRSTAGRPRSASTSGASPGDRTLVKPATTAVLGVQWIGGWFYRSNNEGSARITVAPAP
jgi:hypothetical protein